MQTLTYNCPNCHCGNLEIVEIDTVTFETKQEDDCGPVKVSITGTAKCNNCEAEYWMDAPDVRPAKGEYYEFKKYSSSLEEN